MLDTICRYIGRVAFPIFCFLLVEGFLHTRNVWKYTGRMAIFALICEYPFDLAMRGSVWMSHQNVFCTLLIGLLMMIGIQQIESSTVRYQKPMILFTGLFAAAIAELCRTDYGAIGVMLIFILYMTRDNRMRQCILGAVCMMYEYTSVFAFPLIYLYNGRRKKIFSKYFFYWFYPVHLLLLYGIHQLL